MPWRMRLQTLATRANITLLVTSQVTLLNLSATSMARLGVALLVCACYLDDMKPPLQVL
jgi:hypothetical protein